MTLLRSAAGRALSNSILFLSESNVRKCLPISAAIEANRRALGALRRDGRGGAVVPERIGLQYNPPPSEDGMSQEEEEERPQDWTLFKPAAYYPPPTTPPADGGDAATDADEEDDILMGMKLVSVRSRNPSVGKPTVPATILLLDAATGEVNAILGGTYLTAARTAAGSAVATQLCLERNTRWNGDRDGSKEKKADVTVFGAGLQGEMHIRAMMEVLGKDGAGKVSVVNRSAERAEKLCAALQDEGVASNMEVILLDDVTSIQRAVSHSTVICTATNSATPLFPSSWVRPGTHINGIGSYTPLMEEVDSDLIAARCHLLVDTIEALSVGDLGGMEVGEWLDAENFIGLVGDVLSGEKTVPVVPPKEDGARFDCSMFKSVGTAIQDVVTARVAYEAALREGIGTELDMS